MSIIIMLPHKRLQVLSVKSMADCHLSILINEDLILIESTRKRKDGSESLQICLFPTHKAAFDREKYERLTDHFLQTGTDELSSLFCIFGAILLKGYCFWFRISRPLGQISWRYSL